MVAVLIMLYLPHFLANACRVHCCRCYKFFFYFVQPGSSQGIFQTMPGYSPQYTWDELSGGVIWPATPGILLYTCMI